MPSVQAHLKTFVSIIGARNVRYPAEKLLDLSVCAFEVTLDLLPKILIAQLRACISYDAQVLGKEAAPEWNPFMLS